MQAVEISKTNKSTGKVTITTYTGKDQQDCLGQAKMHPFKAGVILSENDYTWEVIKTNDRNGTTTRLERFQDRYGYKPAFGDYEATGWMDEK